MLRDATVVPNPSASVIEVVNVNARLRARERVAWRRSSRRFCIV